MTLDSYTCECEPYFSSICTPEIRHRREEVKEVLTEADLDKVVDINLSETEMIWLLDMPGIRISSDSDEAAEVRERNQRYQEVRNQKYTISKEKSLI